MISSYRYSCRLALVSLLLLTAVGCGWRPVSEVDIPFPVGESFSTTGEFPPSAPWWQAFQNESLDSLIGMALDRNLTLRQALARVEQSRALAVQAGAARFPTLSVEASATQLTRHAPETGGVAALAAANPSAVATGAVASTGRRVTTEDWQYRGALVTAYEIDLWGRVRAGREAALYLWQAAQEDADAARLAVSGQVGEAWIGLLSQQAALELLQRQVDTLSKYVELVELRFANGQTAAPDVFGQRQQFSAAQARIPPVEAQIALLRHRLAVLLGLPPGEGPEVAGGPPQLPPLPQTGVPAHLLLRRPDVRAARLRVQAADRRVAVAVADRFPALRLTGSFADTSARTEDLFQNWLLTLAAGLTAPVIDGGRRRAEVMAQQAAAEAALAQFGEVALTALREVEDALARERAQQALVERLREQLDSAEKTLTSARRRYMEGVDDYLRVLTALQTLLSVEQGLLAAEYDLIARRMDLYRALAGSWEDVDVTDGRLAQRNERGRPSQ